MRNKVAQFAAAAAAAGLLATAHASPHTLIIGVDGLKPDCIPPAHTPAIDRLIAEGCYNDNAQAEDLTYSGPNWASILHGVHRDKHRVTNNEYRPSRLREWPDFLTYLERHNPDLVTAKVVAPGLIDTDETRALANYAELAKLSPIGRAGTAQEVADLVAFIASEKAGYLSGQVIRLDGGST